MFFFHPWREKSSHRAGEIQIFTLESHACQSKWMSMLYTFFDDSCKYQHFLSYPQKWQFQIRHPYKGAESTGCLVWGRSFSCFQPHGYAPFDPVGMHHATRINEALPSGEWSKVGTLLKIWSFLVAKCVGRMWKSIQIDPYVRAGPLVNYGPAPSVWFQVLLSLACSWAKRSFFAKGHKTTNWIANSLVNLTSQFWSTLIQQLDTTRTLYPSQYLWPFGFKVSWNLTSQVLPISWVSPLFRRQTLCLFLRPHEGILHRRISIFMGFYGCDMRPWHDQYCFEKHKQHTRTPLELLLGNISLFFSP